MRKMRPLHIQIERFWSNVRKSGNCLIWTAAKSYNGYGRYRFNGKNWRAHRLVFILNNKKIPAGMYVDHTCRKRDCVNIKHLRLVTPKQNVIENSIAVPAINAKKKKCHKGHLFSKANTRVYKSGRYCKKCAQEYHKAHWDKHGDAINAKKRKQYHERKNAE